MQSTTIPLRPERSRGENKGCDVIMYHAWYDSFHTAVTVESVWLLLVACWLLDAPKKHFTGIILCMLPANERWCFNVMLSLISWVHTQNEPWFHGAYNPAMSTEVHHLIMLVAIIHVHLIQWFNSHSYLPTSLFNQQCFLHHCSTNNVG